MSVEIRHGNTTFSGEQIKDVKIINETDAMSVNLVESVADITLQLNEEQAVFSIGDVFHIYYNDELHWSGMLKTYKRQGKNQWQLSLSDTIGYLEQFEFVGDVYSNKNVLELINEILGKAGVSGYVYSSGMDEETISGWIPYTNCREALSQVMFAVGWKIRVKTGFSSIQFARITTGNVIDISAKRVLIGNITISDEKITGVEIVAHNYELPEDGTNKKNHYWKAPIYTGENVIITPPSPAYKYDFSRGSANVTWEVLESNANFIKINYTAFDIYEEPTTSFWCTPYLYDYSTGMLGKYIESDTGIDNLVAIENKTLVTSDNIESVLNRCFEYYTKNTEATAKIVVGKHVSDDGTVTYDKDIYCGDEISFPTEYQGTYTGRVIKEQYNLNGNIIIKEITVK